MSDQETQESFDWETSKHETSGQEMRDDEDDYERRRRIAAAAAATAFVMACQALLDQVAHLHTRTLYHTSTARGGNANWGEELLNAGQQLLVWNLKPTCCPHIKPIPHLPSHPLSTDTLMLFLVFLACHLHLL